MFKYRNDGNPYEEFVRAQRLVMRWIKTLKIAEYEYQIEKARRIARGIKSYTIPEASKMREIKRIIGIIEATERLQNKSELKINDFENIVYNETGLEVTREILDKKKKYRDAARKYKTGVRATKKQESSITSVSYINDKRDDILRGSIKWKTEQGIELNETEKEFIMASKKFDPLAPDPMDMDDFSMIKIVDTKEKENK